MTGDDCLEKARLSCPSPVAAYSTTNGMLYLLVVAEAIVFIAIEAKWDRHRSIIHMGVSIPAHITLTCG